METRTEPILQFFAYDHLPEYLQKLGADFVELANHIVETLPRNPERTVALRKLLESRDCTVRICLDTKIKSGGHVGKPDEPILQFFALGTKGPLLGFFAYNSFPEKLCKIRALFCEISMEIVTSPKGQERTVALRKLLESQYCSFRAFEYK